VRRFAKNDRLMRIAGEESSWDVMEFTGEALGDADGDAVKIGSAISTSVAAKQAGIQWVLNTLIQNGQAPPPRELRRILRDYEVGGLEHLFASISRTADAVRRGAPADDDDRAGDSRSTRSTTTPCTSTSIRTSCGPTAYATQRRR
jgi:hypothetical protein